jgi:hypothetical protein
VERIDRAFSPAAIRWRDNPADGPHRRRIIADRPSHGIFHWRCSRTSNFSNAAVLRHSQRGRTIGRDLADSRARSGADGVDGVRTDRLGDLGELGSMVVSQQIDAMRALGADPNKKLVAPRLIALIVMLPLLTVAADIFGIVGGGTVASYIFDQDVNVFITSVRNGICTEDILGGIIKPVFFGMLIGGIACYKGLSTTGGTVGVGRSTINAVVLSSIWVIIFDFFLARALQSILGVGII